MRQTVSILGIPVDHLDNLATLDCLDRFIQQGGFHQVATANADFIINAMQDRELRQILCTADLVTPDGMPVVWASKLLGAPLPERVTGADLVPKLAELAARKGYRIYMLGAMPEVAQRARQRLEEAHPDIKIVGCTSPRVKVLSSANDELLEDIKRAQPDILLVACGNPKQEKWINTHRDRLEHVAVCIGVGGTFDFIAGETLRAPRWMQRFGLEWFFRLIQEPRRLWRRYVRDLFYFSIYLARQAWVMRGRRNRSGATVTSTCVQSYKIVGIRQSFGRDQLNDFNRIATNALETSPHLIINLDGSIDFDATALGILVVLAKRAREMGREVRVVGADPRTKRILHTTFVHESLSLYDTLDEALVPEPMTRLQVSLDCGHDHAVVNLCGLADFQYVERVNQVLSMVPASICQIDIDLRSTTHIDCNMLAGLIRFVRDKEATGHRVRLVVNAAVRQVLNAEKVLDEFVLVDVPVASSLLIETVETISV